jgi:hypothetical protein
VQVATCPGPAGHTFLSLGHDPQASGSNEGVPHVIGIVLQVSQPLHPNVGTGALKTEIIYLISKTTMYKYVEGRDHAYAGQDPPLSACRFQDGIRGVLGFHCRAW